MNRIFFFDIDNTLVDPATHTIPPSALKAIAHLKDCGHTVAIATGRSLGHAREFIDEVSPRYVISQNGARIRKEEDIVLSLPMPREPLTRLFEGLHGQGHPFGVNDGRMSYISENHPFIEEALRGIRMDFQSDDPFYRYRDVFQGWLFFDEALDQELFPVILERYPMFELVRWHRRAVDVLRRDVNKWMGCQWVLADAGFKPEEAIAFGDGLNDKEMLQGVGLGIAMDNGHPELKAIADLIAPALNRDGIAAMLDELAETGRIKGPAAKRGA